jgi:anti-anti-sigma factor
MDLANAETVREDLLAALGSGAAIVVADLMSTGYCDSTGFRTLTAVHRAGTAMGGQLRLAVNPAGVVARALTVLELDRLLYVYPSIRDALTGLD